MLVTVWLLIFVVAAEAEIVAKLHENTPGICVIQKSIARNRPRVYVKPIHKDDDCSASDCHHELESVVIMESYLAKENRTVCCSGWTYVDTDVGPTCEPLHIGKDDKKLYKWIYVVLGVVLFIFPTYVFAVTITTLLLMISTKRLNKSSDDKGTELPIDSSEEITEPPAVKTDTLILQIETEATVSDMDIVNLGNITESLTVEADMPILQTVSYPSNVGKIYSENKTESGIVEINNHMLEMQTATTPYTMPSNIESVYLDNTAGSYTVDTDVPIVETNISTTPYPAASGIIYSENTTSSTVKTNMPVLESKISKTIYSSASNFGLVFPESKVESSTMPPLETEMSKTRNSSESDFGHVYSENATKPPLVQTATPKLETKIPTTQHSIVSEVKSSYSEIQPEKNYLPMKRKNVTYPSNILPRIHNSIQNSELRESDSDAPRTYPTRIFNPDIKLDLLSEKRNSPKKFNSIYPSNTLEEISDSVKRKVIYPSNYYDLF